MARGWAEGAGLGHEGPGDVVVPLLHQPLVLQRPDIVAEASVAALGDLLEVLFVVAKPQLPLRCRHTNVSLVRRPLLLGGALRQVHLDCGLVDHLLRDALPTKRTLASIPLPLWAAAVAPRPLGDDRGPAGQHLVVVGADHPGKIRHRGVADLYGAAVKILCSRCPGGKQVSTSRRNRRPMSVFTLLYIIYIAITSQIISFILYSSVS